jgi:CubicO group peptidase (beta-lactamase class C family)
MPRSTLNRRSFLTASTGGLAAAVASAMPRPSGSTERECLLDNSGHRSALLQTDTGVVYHRDIHRSDMMKGFPPPPDKRVTIHNWPDHTDALRWTHLNGSYVFKTIPIEGPNGPVWVLPRHMLDREKLETAKVLWGKTNEEAQRISVRDWLLRSETDAFVVLHEGHIVAEHYFGDMTPTTPHRLWSASKSVLASTFASLLFTRSVEEEAPAERYVSELAQCGLAGASVRQLLDMYTGVAVPCFPSAEELGINDEAALKQWTLGTPEFRRADNQFARMCRAMGVFPSLPEEETTGCYDFVLATERDREHGTCFYYTDPNPIALQWILERRTGASYVDHLSKLLQSLGAEGKATITLDAIGTAVSSIGLSLTARDFARWGLMLCNGGRVNNGQVIPGIQHFVDDIRRNPGLDRWTERTNAAAWAPAGTGYRSQMWTAPTASGTEPVLYASGAFHQVCYVDARRKYVLVKFSSFLPELPERPREDRFFHNDAIAAQSFLNHTLPDLLL